MSDEEVWNTCGTIIDIIIMKFSERKLSQCQFSFPQQILGIGMGGEQNPSELETGDKPPQLRHENLVL